MTSTSLTVTTDQATPVLLTVEADRAARVLMRKSPETQRTYQGIYTRFAGWLANHNGLAEAPVEAFTAEALVAYFDEREELVAASTVKKERAALRKLARYLHQLGAIDATVILMVEIPTETDTAPARQGLDQVTWDRVLAHARARSTPTARARGSREAAVRDLALLQVLGGAGLRSGEARRLPVSPFDQGRADNQGGSVYLRVHGKGRKLRSVPLWGDVVDALEHWQRIREEIPQLADDPSLFPQLGRRRANSSFPDAGGQLSTAAVAAIVRPIMLAAGVPAHQAHPHTLRHTFGRTYMARRGAELSFLQQIMGHASPDTTSRYVHHSTEELGREHLRLEREVRDPLTRHQQHRSDRAARQR